MTLSMYQASVPVFVRVFANMSGILKKGEDYAVQSKFDPGILLGSRLAPDMHPLVRQVQIACDMAKGGVVRLAGIESPVFDDTETSFADLQARIARTVLFIQAVKPEQMDGSEGKTITLKLPSRELSFPGHQYLLGFVLPNLFFHATTAFAILRHNGVPIGKMDFIGGA